MTNAVESLMDQLAAAEKEIARLGGVNRNFSDRLHRGCCCQFEDDGETARSWCGPHADLRDRLIAAEAVIEAARTIHECAKGIMPIHDSIETLRPVIIKLNDARWTRLFAIYAEADEALTAYDKAQK